MIGLFLDKSMILSILPLVVAIPVALGLLIFLSAKLRQSPSKPVSRTTGEHFQKIGRSLPDEPYTDSAGTLARTASPYPAAEQLPGLDEH
jgi:hypothetical protein